MVNRFSSMVRESQPASFSARLTYCSQSRGYSICYSVASLSDIFHREVKLVSRMQVFIRNRYQMAHYNRHNVTTASSTFKFVFLFIDSRLEDMMLPRLVAKAYGVKRLPLNLDKAHFM